jgi:hypothetical protein
LKGHRQPALHLSTAALIFPTKLSGPVPALISILPAGEARGAFGILRAEKSC